MSAPPRGRGGGTFLIGDGSVLGLPLSDGLPGSVEARFVLLWAHPQTLRFIVLERLGFLFHCHRTHDIQSSAYLIDPVISYVTTINGKPSTGTGTPYTVAGSPRRTRREVAGARPGKRARWVSTPCFCLRATISRMAGTSNEFITDLIGLPEVARRLQVSCATARTLVYRGRLPARRLGQLWYVERDVLEEFAATYERKRPKAVQRHTTNTDSRERVARLLVEWQEATAEELAVGIRLHPGNVRKHLVILESAGFAEREDSGFWRLTDAGRRLYRKAAKAS